MCRSQSRIESALKARASLIGVVAPRVSAADEAAIHDAYLHMVAATLHTYSNNLRLDSLSRGRLRAHDTDQRHRALLRFVAGGITRLATS